MREHDCSIAFAINDIPIWEHSGLSKMAAYNHAMTNLVDGGYYLESRKENNKPEFISFEVDIYNEKKELLSSIPCFTNKINCIKLSDYIIFFK